MAAPIEALGLPCISAPNLFLAKNLGLRPDVTAPSITIPAHAAGRCISSSSDDKMAYQDAPASHITGFGIRAEPSKHLLDPSKPLSERMFTCLHDFHMNVLIDVGYRKSSPLL